jgi:excisionase family DNA binding protein
MGKKITIREASGPEYLDMTHQAIRRLIARGDLPAYQVGSTRNLRVDTDDLQKLYRPLPTGGRKSGAA